MEFLYIINRPPIYSVVPLIISILISILAYFWVSKKESTSTSLKRLIYRKSIWNIQKPKDFFWLFILVNLHAILTIEILAVSTIPLALWVFFFLSASLIFFTLQIILPLTILLQFIPTKLKTRKIWEKTSKKRKIGLTIYAVLVLLISLDAYFIEPNNIKVSHHELPTEKDVPALKIVHITDIQTDKLGYREKKTPEIIKKLNPDLILITGDYTNGPTARVPEGKKSARYVLENLDAPYGVFAVSGNANPPDDHEELFKNTKVQYLENESVKITVDGKEIYLIGIDWWYPDFKKAFKNVPKNAYKIVLYHTPDIILNEYSKKSDLILVGHTHGGQINLPFIGPIISATKVGRKYAKGTFKIDEDSILYVNRGLGLEGFIAPRIRFLCPPEIAVFKLNELVEKVTNSSNFTISRPARQ